jgi:hypothetical protein
MGREWRGSREGKPTATGAHIPHVSGDLSRRAVSGKRIAGRGLCGPFLSMQDRPARRSPGPAKTANPAEAKAWRPRKSASDFHRFVTVGQPSLSGFLGLDLL